MERIQIKMPILNTKHESPNQGFLSSLRRIANLYTYPLRLSHYAELVNPLWSTHQLQVKVVSVWDETANARTLTLKPGRNWQTHRAGQHAHFGVSVNGRRFTRTYTISSHPERDDGCFTITVKAIDGGRISHHLVRSVKVGDYLDVGLPQGDFFLPDAVPVEPLFITAGSGITPAISMLRSLMAQQRLPKTVHIHYAPRERDVIFGGELAKIVAEHSQYCLHRIYTHKYAAEKQAKGYFNEAQLERLCPDWRDRDVYACGPPGLLAALETHFQAAGLSHRLHTERFLADFSPLPEDAIGGLVRFVDSNAEVMADATTPLLRVAEYAGLNPPHGCRMGICHTCTRQLISGCVRDLRDNRVINEPGTRIQTCVCAAAGDCEIEL